MNKQLHQALVSALINEADDTAAADEPRKEHTPRAGDVVYTHDELHSEEPKKINEVVFFGIVKGW